MHELMDMGTNTCIVAFGDVAIEAEDLQVGRKSFAFDSGVELLPHIAAISSVCRSVIVDMIQRQEGRIGFAAAHALAAVVGQHLFLEPFRSSPSGLAVKFSAWITQRNLVIGTLSTTISAASCLHVFLSATRAAQSVCFVFGECATAIRTICLSGAVCGRITISPPSVIMHRTPITGEARQIATINGAECVRHGGSPSCEWVAVSLPSPVMGAAQISGKNWFITLVDCTRLSHFRPHSSVAYVRKEIKSWAA